MKFVFHILQISCISTVKIASERAYFNRNILGEFFLEWLGEERNKV